MLDLLNFFQIETDEVITFVSGGAVQDDGEKSMQEQIHEMLPPKKGYWSNDSDETEEFGDLNEELEYWASIKDELIAKNKTGSVVIKNKHLIGVWPDRWTAVKEGLDILGDQNMLIADLNYQPPRMPVRIDPPYLAKGMEQ
jgi:hypothetical protein